MADCKAYREEIEDSAGVGSLSVEARSHAGACPACGKFGRERDALRRLVGGLGKVEAPADFEFRLRARMKASKGRGGKYNFLGLRFAPGFAWAAVLCFVVVSASLYVWQGRRSPQVAQQASSNNESGSVVAGVDGENRLAESKPAIKAAKFDGPTEAVAVNRAGDNIRRVSLRLRFKGVVRNEPDKKTPSVVSSEYGVRVARILSLKIPHSTSPESLRFVVRDERGNTRPVPMRAVSFGSQELMAGVSARMAATDKGGVW